MMRGIKVMLIMLIAMGLFAGSAFALINQSFEVATDEYGYRFPVQWWGNALIIGAPPEPDPTSVIVYHEDDPDEAKFGDDYLEYTPSDGWITTYPPLCEEEEIVFGETYTFELWLKRPPGSSTATGIKLEWYNQACGEYPATGFIGWTEYPHTFSADNTWEKQTVTATPLVGATHLRIAIYRPGGASGSGSQYFYDGLSSSLDVPVPWNPTPAHDSAVDVATTTISWTNPWTEEPINSTTVYFSIDPNDIYHENAGAIVGGVSAGDESATIPVSLIDGADYYWGVKLDIGTLGTFSNYDPITGTGAWHFIVGDAPPIVNPSDMYVWIDMDDGFDTDANDVTVQLDGNVIDDGKSPVVYHWNTNSSTASDPTVVWLDPNDIEHPRVVLSDIGEWVFGLTVEDGTYTIANGQESYGELHVTVYPDACSAAIGDPSDEMPASDINEDCETNIEDLLAVADSWLECMSDKLIGVNPECTP